MDIELSDLINTIWEIKHANALPNYINYIQFPFFRNIELDQRINFNFPLTAFIGPNGSGKSSTLHALYGCPEGKTPYEFWFSTTLDPISYYSADGRKLRHSFFYGYRDLSNEEQQVIKARIRRENNPDYWETSRPIISAGMKEIADGKRNPPIKKNIVYFDFRSELSAFDKYFYFETPPSYLISRTPQDYLRNRSGRLKSLFNNVYPIISVHSKEQNKPLEILDQTELEIISDILGKKYSDTKIIYHKLFHNWGYSIQVKTDYHQYSEAFAGSGEMAVIRLVHKLLNAEQGSLVLLDEPEVSLHPGAQNKLKHFLLDQIKSNKHQIIISTHSPTLIENLPREAIKVFSQNVDTGRFIIKENIYPEEAFYFIGKVISDKMTIIVEDKLAMKIIKVVVAELGEEVKNRFEIKLLPGGAKTIQQQISVYSNMGIKKTFFVFDGDQKYVKKFFDIRTLTDAQKNTKFLMEKILDQTESKITFYPDSGDEDNKERQLVQMMISYLKYYSEQVFYLPQQTPDDIIWDENIVREKLSPNDFNEFSDIRNHLGTSKAKIYESAKLLFGNDQNSSALEDLLINEWKKKRNDNYLRIEEIIKEIENRVDHQIREDNS